MASTIIIIIISIIFMTVGFILNVARVEVFDVIFITLGTFIFTATGMEVSNQNKPTAIDVYRGKTTLKITYVDGVATDSVVVFKEQ